MAATPLTTHVLDTSSGAPAAGLTITLHWLPPADTDGGGNSPVLLSRTVTNADGRVTGRELVPVGADWVAGTYRLRFETGPYFAPAPCFYPYAEVVFTVTDPAAHYHVPLLVAPFGYSTYRGS
ncbi:hypothetical protein MMPV_002645 [Pyropia vietnamensis]